MFAVRRLPSTTFSRGIKAALKPRSISNVGPQTEKVAEDSVPKIWGRPISELPDSDFTDRTSPYPLTWGGVVVAISLCISVYLGDNVPSEEALKYKKSFH